MTTLIHACHQVRETLEAEADIVLHLRDHPELNLSANEKSGKNTNEAFANIMLAYRHIEDCKMRIGKVIQAMDGGVSIYDKVKDGD